MSGSGGGGLFPTTQSNNGSQGMGPQWSPIPSYMGDASQRMDAYDTMRAGFSERMNAAGANAPFNEDYYLNSNPDVAAAVQAGQFQSGLDHYNQFGQAEGRQGGFVSMSDVLSPEEQWARWTGHEQAKLDRVYTKFTDPRAEIKFGKNEHMMNKYNHMWDRTQSDNYQRRVNREYTSIFGSQPQQPQQSSFGDIWGQLGNVIGGYF